jgi:glycosyltransferase involved in cell wall biosynthesis
MTGEYSTPAFRQRFAEQAREAAQSSDLIICVSAFTASQVEALLGVEKSRLRVIHHGVRPPAEPPADAMRQRMVLCVGSIQKRKNMTRLVQAFSRTAPGWRLVLAGGAGFAAEETFAAIAESPRREDIRVTGYVSEQALARLYSQASLFAFPSLDEGFGIPVLEAMAWGVPVLTSDHAALREVSGGAALLANPHDVESIRHALQRMMDDEDLRCSLAKQGHTWSAGFRWDNAVSQTWRVYEELL